MSIICKNVPRHSDVVGVGAFRPREPLASVARGGYEIGKRPVLLRDGLARIQSMAAHRSVRADSAFLRSPALISAAAEEGRFEHPFGNGSGFYARGTEQKIVSE